MKNRKCFVSLALVLVSVLFATGCQQQVVPMTTSTATVTEITITGTPTNTTAAVVAPVTTVTPDPTTASMPTATSTITLATSTTTTATVVVTTSSDVVVTLPVASISFASLSSISLPANGATWVKTIQLTAIVTYALSVAPNGLLIGGNSVDNPPGLVWTSSNPNVATVSFDGLVVAVAPGLTNITATMSGAVSPSILVKVQ